MLSTGGLAQTEMSKVLQEPPNYVSDESSIERMLDLLKHHQLIYSDPEGRWRVKAELEGTVRRYLDPSPLAAKMLELATNMRRSVDGLNGAIDHPEFQQHFREQLDAIREKLKTEYAETDPAFSWVPSDVSRVRQMADTLERIARKIP
jgi:hypothetical protein